MTENVYAFDPGTLTGVVVWDADNGLTYADQLNVFDLYAFVDERCADIMHAQIERFTISERTIKASRVDDPLDVIGYLKYAAWRCEFPWEFSKPSDVMATYTDAALKRAGLFTKGKGHANDAARHLARHLVRARLIDPKVFL